MPLRVGQEDHTMEHISRLVLFLVFLYCTSESQSASVLERRFLSSPPAADTSTGSNEDLGSPTHPVAGMDSGSAELLLELADEEKPRIGLPVQGYGIRDDTRHGIQENRKETAAILANFLDGRHQNGKGRLFPGRADWGVEQEQRFQENTGEGQGSSASRSPEKGGVWTLLNRRYEQKEPQRAMTTTLQQQRILGDMGYQQQSVKRSPACLKKCIAQGFLHPAQCHSLC